eukprot:2293161-Amphidinium_carterae.1
MVVRTRRLHGLYYSKSTARRQWRVPLYQHSELPLMGRFASEVQTVGKLRKLLRTWGYTAAPTFEARIFIANTWSLLEAVVGNDSTVAPHCALHACLAQNRQPVLSWTKNASCPARTRVLSLVHHTGDGGRCGAWLCNAMFQKAAQLNYVPNVCSCD